MIEIACPHCGSTNQLGDQFAGLRVPCKVCSKEFKVPLSFKALGASASSPSSSSTSAASAPLPPSDLDDPLFASPPSSTPAKPAAAPTVPTTGKTPAAPGPTPPAPLAPASKPAQPTTSGWQASVPANKRSEPLAPLSFDGEVESSPPPTPVAPSTNTNASIPVDELELWDDPAPKSASLPSPNKESDPPVYDSVRSSLKLEGMVDAEADDIRAKCGVCDAVIWVKRHKAGSTVVCPDCTSEVKVPVGQPVARAPQGPKAGEITSKVFTGVASTETDTKGWRDRPTAAHEKSDRAKKLEQIEGQKTLPRNRQRVWGQPPDPEKPPEADEAASTKDRPAQTDEPELYDVDDWIRDTLSVLIDKGFLLGVIGVGLITIPYMLLLWWRLIYLSALQSSGIATTFALAGSTVAWGVLLSVKSVVGATVVIDSANRNPRIESWPEFNVGALLSQGLLYFIPSLIAAVPAGLLGEVAYFVGLPTFIWIPLSLFLEMAIISPFLLSAIRNGSPLHLFDPEIFATIKTEGRTWAIGICMLMALVVVEAISLLLSLYLGICFGLFGCIFLALSWGLQVRVIGILGRRLGYAMDKVRD